MNTIHDENKIEEIIKSLKHKTLGTEESRIYSAMKEYAQYIREKTIDECVVIVEKYRKDNLNEDTSFAFQKKGGAGQVGYEWACDEIIINLSNLKNNE